MIGRNQNPWRELDVSCMRKLGIKLVRRRSGGGSVYHDLGNTNYSFHIAREHFTRRTHAELVARALNSDPVRLTDSSPSDPGDGPKGAYVNERNDICVALRSGPNAASEERKVSGSAYKITSSRAYHHGTMLLSSNLADLGSALRPSRSTMDSKGVASVPSPVVNLSQAFPSRRASLTHDAFCQAVLAEFQRTYGRAEVCDGISEENYADVLMDEKQDVLKGWQEMDSWDWIWGQTPEFTHRIRCEGMLLGGDLGSLPSFEIDLHVKHGIVQEARVRTDDLHAQDDDLVSFVARLGSARYDVLANAPDTYGGGQAGSRSSQELQGLHELRFSEEDRSRQVAVAYRLLPWLKSVL